MSRPTRPTFSPLPWLPDDPCAPLATAAQGLSWTPVCSCPADFPIQLFGGAISQLVFHPEYNSTLILRSEMISETDEKDISPQGVPCLEGFYVARNLHRKLLPRRPERDPPIEQHCTFYSTREPCSLDTFGNTGNTPVSCLILTPILSAGEKLPFYHPSVSHLAFRYIPRPGQLTENSQAHHLESRIRIEIVPGADSTDTRDPNSRLYRTCLALLETVHRYGWGALTNYQKRVHHDCLIAKEEYQDLYLVMRERHKYLINQWHEKTDPLKHVFEDIGIATFLMLLWKHSFTVSDPNTDQVDNDTEQDGGIMPWQGWPRPAGGFLDFGCGNGLLVHILLSEGYIGDGIDIRSRTSWGHYTPATQKHLHVHAFNPENLAVCSETGQSLDPFFKPDIFIIANHADELSPWTSVVATICDASGYLSIPCCPWSFDAKFQRSLLSQCNVLTPFSFALPEGTTEEKFSDTLKLGSDSSKSSYSSYRIWLATVSLYCGWEIETETLRIPSTRNWSIVGRRHCMERDVALENVSKILRQVSERGLFKARRPEGNVGNH